jgi:predicted DNA-binding helix-hairpin-helix protein
MSSDPLTGPPEQRDAYIESIMEKVQGHIEADRNARRTAFLAESGGRSPIIIGAEGSPDSIVMSVRQ